MGNKFTRRRAIVDEQYTRTQGLYQHRDLDPRKLRKLILSGQLAPCFPGVEEASPDLDECPICFLFYPSLNRSKCCTKSICTECFLQIKSPHLARPPQCPFCKTPSYVVEYRGAKSLEEKGVEQAEEQKVIEAKIRIRQKELQEEKERMDRREEGIVADDVMRNVPAVPDVQSQGLTVADALNSDDQPSLSEPILGSQTTMQTASSGRYRHTSFNRSNRENDFDIDLEDIMVMEAIWLSIQEQSQMRQESCLSQQRIPEVSSDTLAENIPSTCSTMGGQGSNELRSVAGRSSLQGGLVGAIAALAERQIGSIASLSGPGQINIESESSCAPTDDIEQPENLRSRPSLTLRGQLQRTAEMEQVEGMLKTTQSHNGSQELSTWMDDSVGNGRSFSLHLQRENRGSDWLLDHSSEAVEVGTSFSSSVPSASELPWEAPDYILSQGNDVSSDLPLMNPNPVLPESYEEQIMLAMALSLADAQSQTRGS